MLLRLTASRDLHPIFVQALTLPIGLIDQTRVERIESDMLVRVTDALEYLCLHHVDISWF